MKRPFILYLRLIFLLSFCGMLQGCSWFTTVKRYRVLDETVIENKITEKPGDQDNKDMKVTMILSETKIDPVDKKPGFRSLWDLQGQGQKQLVESLDKRFKDNEKFLGNLEDKYLKSDDDDRVLDFTKKKVKFVFSVSRWRPYENLGKKDVAFSLADRIEYLSYDLNFTDDNLRFLGWNKYSTEYGTVNIADMSFQTSISGGLGFGDTTSGLNASVSASGSRTESEHVQYRYLQLSGNLDKNHLHLESEGTREADLAGNVVAEVTMQFKPYTVYLFSVDKLKDDDGNYKPPSKLDLKTTVALVPDESVIKDIPATLTYSYVYRHVKSKANTFFEWDDRVQYYKGSVEKPVNILVHSDIMPDFYSAILVGDAGNNWLQVRRPNTAPGFDTADLIFADRKSADEFLTWLYYYPDSTNITAPIKFKNDFTLLYMGVPVTKQTLQANSLPGPKLFSFKYFQDPAW